MPDGTVILNDLDGGSVIVSPQLGVSFHEWSGPDGLVGREVERLSDLRGEECHGED